MHVSTLEPWSLFDVYVFSRLYIITANYIRWCATRFTALEVLKISVRSDRNEYIQSPSATLPDQTFTNKLYRLLRTVLRFQRIPDPTAVRGRDY